MDLSPPPTPRPCGFRSPPASIRYGQIPPVNASPGFRFPPTSRDDGKVATPIYYGVVWAKFSA